VLVGGGGAVELPWDKIIIIIGFYKWYRQQAMCGAFRYAAEQRLAAALQISDTEDDWY